MKGKQKHNWYVSTLTLVFVNQKRMNICGLCYLYWMLTYIYSLLIAKDHHENQHVWIKFLCLLLVYLFLSSRDLLIFFWEFFLFIPVFVLPVHWYFPFSWCLFNSLDIFINMSIKRETFLHVKLGSKEKC